MVEFYDWEAGDEDFVAWAPQWVSDTELARKGVERLGISTQGYTLELTQGWIHYDDGDIYPCADQECEYASEEEKATFISLVLAGT